MGYRRSERSAGWSSRIAQMDELRMRSGIPQWLIGDERAWLHFVDSGYSVDMEKSFFFKVTDLNAKHVLALAELVLALGHSQSQVLSCIGPHPARPMVEQYLSELRSES